MAKRRPYETLAANVQRLAHLQGLSLDAVAGTFDPDLELVDRLAQAVGVTASELITEPEFN